jgi:hypothetical protein
MFYDGGSNHGVMPDGDVVFMDADEGLRVGHLQETWCEPADAELGIVICTVRWESEEHEELIDIVDSRDLRILNNSEPFPTAHFVEKHRAAHKARARREKAERIEKIALEMRAGSRARPTLEALDTHISHKVMR